MPHQPFSPIPASVARVQSEWEAHTRRHQAGSGWGTFRALASVIQVAASFVLVSGFVIQLPFVLSQFSETHWIHRLAPSPFELGMLFIVAAPEWLDVFFFGRADRALRAYGVLKVVDPDKRPPDVPSPSALQALWLGQMFSRLTNLAVHVLFAVAISGAVFYGVRDSLRDNPVPGGVASLERPSR